MVDDVLRSLSAPREEGGLGGRGLTLYTLAKVRYVHAGEQPSVAAQLRKAKNPHLFQHDNPQSSALTLTYGDVLLSEYSPAETLLEQLAQDGYRVDGPPYELRSLAKRMDMTMRLMAGNVRQAMDGFEQDRRKLPRAELHVFPGAGHDPGLTHAAEMSGLTDTHLARS